MRQWLLILYSPHFVLCAAALLQGHLKVRLHYQWHAGHLHISIYSMELPGFIRQAKLAVRPLICGGDSASRTMSFVLFCQVD